jgi:phosphohistidine phosphatase SixA
MRVFLTFAAALSMATTSALAQHHSHHAGHQAAGRPHAHWHANPAAVKTAVALQKGGLVVFFRHGKTDMLAVDQQPIDFSDCSKQRNLSPAGVAASREMGDAIRQLKIPVGMVLSSPYCRCMDTARLAFAKVEASDALLVKRTASGWDLDAAGNALRRLVATPPASGTNTMLVAHIFNIEKSFGIMPEEGAATTWSGASQQPNGAIWFATSSSSRWIRHCWIICMVARRRTYQAATRASTTRACV